MNRFTASAILTGFLAVTACGAGGEVDLEAEKADARAAAGELGRTLKGELVGAMQSGGPVEAIEVCAVRAPEIAAQVSEDTGMEVARTALRVRNASNTPDAWEREQLEHYLRLMGDGRPVSELPEIAEFVDTGDGTAFRWMKPIAMGGVCATCHGKSVAEPVRAAIEARYPDDAATGFEEGDLRGAFTVSKPLGGSQ